MMSPGGHDIRQADMTSLARETCHPAWAVLTVIAIALVVALLVIALVAVPLWRKRPAPPEPVLEVAEAPLEGVVPLPGPADRGPPLPVVLVHGLFGFDRIGKVLDVPGVRYACVVGGMHRDDSFVPLALVPAHAYLRRIAGSNDGLVPIASQYRGETLAEIEADHFAQIGWRVAVRKTFDAPGLYASVIARLGDAPVQVAAAAR
jgi:hypothetical protein